MRLKIIFMIFHVGFMTIFQVHVNSKRHYIPRVGGLPAAGSPTEKESLKDVHIYCKINELSGQFSDPHAEFQ